MNPLQNPSASHSQAPGATLRRAPNAAGSRPGATRRGHGPRDLPRRDQYHGGVAGDQLPLASPVQQPTGPLSQAHDSSATSSGYVELLISYLRSHRLTCLPFTSDNNALRRDDQDALSISTRGSGSSLQGTSFQYSQWSK